MKFPLIQISILGSIMFCLLIIGCKGGNTAKSSVQVEQSGRVDTTLVEIDKKYTGIVADAAINVVMSDSVKLLLIMTDTAVRPYVTATVEGGELRLGYKAGTSINGNFAGTTIWVPYDASVKSVTLNGASSFRSQHPLVGSRFQMSLGGASRAVCYFDMPDGDLVLSLNGASALRAVGCVGNLMAEINGASKLVSDEENGQYTFSVSNAELEVNGVSEVQLHSTGRLSGSVNGVSQLSYTGQPKQKMSSNGLSRVKRKG